MSAYSITHQTNELNISRLFGRINHFCRKIIKENTAKFNSFFMPMIPRAHTGMRRSNGWCLACSRFHFIFIFLLQTSRCAWFKQKQLFSILGQLNLHLKQQRDINSVFLCRQKLREKEDAKSKCGYLRPMQLNKDLQKTACVIVILHTSYYMPTWKKWKSSSAEQV